jgi:SAM-dependent methyltransferase
MEAPDTGERYAPELPGELSGERLHWYALASEMAPGIDVLDIASGDGLGAAYLAAVARSVVGVDNDLRTVRGAAARHAALNLSFLAGSAIGIPLGDESVDLVVSFERLEGIAEEEQFIGEIVRVLRPHGRLMIASRNKAARSERETRPRALRLRELYFDEFRDLLVDSFADCRIYEQRPVAAWAVHPLGADAGKARLIDAAAGRREPALKPPARPAYFIAACARVRPAGESESFASIFVDSREERLERKAPPHALPVEPHRAVDEPSAPPEEAPALPQPVAEQAEEATPVVSEPPAAQVPPPQLPRPSAGLERLERVAMLLARERNDLAAMLRSPGAADGEIAAALGETHGELARTFEAMTSTRTGLHQAIGSRNDASGEPEST